jgi:hypothetical protein
MTGTTILRRLAPAAVFAATVGGLAFGSGLVFERLIPALPAAVASSVTSSPPNHLELAQHFTIALNAHDVDALVELFTDDDDNNGASVHADRYAWNKVEIRAWAQQQVRANTYMDARDHRVTRNGAAWNAELYREDWRQLGVYSVSMLNSIWVQNGKLVDFTSTPLDHHDVVQLGRLWQPGVSP